MPEITYYIVFSVFLLLALFDFVAKKDKGYLIIYSLIAFFILIYAGFRTCSIDYQGYKYNYDLLRNTSILNIFEAGMLFEPAYVVLNILSPNFESVIFIMALVNIVILFPFFFKYSPYPFITILLYSGMFLYSGLMGLVRQSLAISICLWAMVDPKNKKFFLLIIVAMTFHVTALIVCSVRFLKNKVYSVKQYASILALAILSNILMYDVFASVINYFPGIMAAKLNYYLMIEEGTGFGFNSAVAIRLLTFVLALWHIKAISSKFRIGPLILNLYFLSLVFYVAFGFLPQVAARGAIFFHYIELLIVPMIIYVAKPSVRVGVFTLYSFFALSRHITMLDTHAEYYIPYTNLLFR